MVEYQTKKKNKKNIGFFFNGRENVFNLFKGNRSWVNVMDDISPEQISSSPKIPIKNKLKEKQSKLTLKQILQSLLIAFGQVKTGTTSGNVLNKIHEVIYSLYPAKEVNEKVYNKIMNLIQI